MYSGEIIIKSSFTAPLALVVLQKEFKVNVLLDSKINAVHVVLCC
jgi:hypothetical protein